MIEEKGSPFYLIALIIKESDKYLIMLIKDLLEIRYRRYRDVMKSMKYFLFYWYFI